MNIQTLLIAGITLTALTLTLYMNTRNTQDKQYYQEFLEFKSQYNKLHSSPQEMEYRYSIFIQNIKEIEEHNKTDSTYKLGINQFSDLTWEEFKEGYLAQEIINTTFNPEGQIMKDVKPIDWRKENIVTPVKNQGQCGSCWAFSTTGSFESYLAQKDKKLPSLSEQELVDCSRSYGNFGCGGGLMTYAYNYIKEHKITTEDSYPYKARNQACNRKDEGDRYQIDNYTILKSAQVKTLSQYLDKRPVSVAVEVNSKFQQYKSGVFSFDRSCGRRLNHAILLVGQQDNYYIVKNSWGEGWGEKGYIRMEIGSGSGNCGIANKWDVIPGSV